MKTAARKIVESLTIADRVAIISFNDNATAFANEDRYLFEANKANRKALSKQIDSFEGDGGTNIIAAAQETFRVLMDSADQEELVRCGPIAAANTVIMFITDGEATRPLGVTTAELETMAEDLVRKMFEALRAKLGSEPFLFTYSVDDLAADRFARAIVCEATENGFWERVTSSRIVRSLTSYSKTLTLGLSAPENKGFVALTEPYIFWSSGMNCVVQLSIF